MIWYNKDTEKALGNFSARGVLRNKNPLVEVLIKTANWRKSISEVCSFYLKNTPARLCKCFPSPPVLRKFIPRVYPKAAVRDGTSGN